MSETELTTVQIDLETRDMLRELASHYERSMAAHLRWLIKQEFDNLFKAFTTNSITPGDPTMPREGTGK